MKHVKILALGLVATASLMAFVGAGTASATFLEKEGDAQLGNGAEIHAVLEGVAKLQIGFKTAECEESTIQYTVEVAGGVTTRVSGKTKAVTVGKCNCAAVSFSNGKFEIEEVSTEGSGTLVASEFTAAATCSTIFGTITCKYIIEKKRDVGTLVGSADREDETATMRISTTLPDEGSSPSCAEAGIWEASYLITTPDTLNVTETPEK